jgi:hypothetical protein
MSCGGRTPWLLLALALAAAAGTGCETVGAGIAPEPPPYRVTGKPTAGPLVLRRIELTFPDGRGEATVKRSDPALGAPAVIGFQGSGPLQATWVVDGRQLEPVSMMLSLGDTRTLRTSPSSSLPTFEPGTHTVTLEIQQPAPALRAPTIRYTVAVDEAPVPAGVKP